MSPVRGDGRQAGERFPRVSGDEPCTQSIWYFFIPFSPRERG